jgi:outer membrane protein
MRNPQALIAMTCVALLAAPPGFAGQNIDLRTPQPIGNERLGSLRHTYQARTVPPPNYHDSTRLDQLVRAGKIYLSLDDAIALTLENNLDLEVARYGQRIAEADLLRAEAGGFIQGIPTSVQSGPSSSGVLAGNVLGNSGGGGGGGGIFGGINIQAIGTQVPALDPVISINTQIGHYTSPQTSTFLTATSTNALVQTFKGTFVTIQKGFLSGTNLSYSFNNGFLAENSPNDDFTPWTQANMQLQLTQQLLRGFRPAVNTRLIHVAKNNMHVSDLVFKLQVMTTTAAVINLYWDLVALDEQVKVKRQAVELAQKLYSDNKKEVAIGTLAPIEIVRAEAEVARTQQELTNAETQVLEQETILKNALSRSDVDDPLLAQARIMPTDNIRVPDVQPVTPVQDLYSAALQERPEVEESQIQLTNSKLNSRGTKDALLPTFDVFAQLRNNALAGQVNSLPIPPPPGSPPGTPFTKRDPATVDPFFIGGWGSAVAQLFRRNFPDYTVGFQLNIPLRNRSAQSDAIRDELNQRQQELNDRKLRKQVKVDVQNAVIALQQAFASYQTAVKSRILTEQTLQAERRRFAMGVTTSTIVTVIQAQRDLSQAQLVEVAALNAYSRAQTQVEAATGEILANHHIIMDEAMHGQVSRAPSAIPVLDTPPRSQLSPAPGAPASQIRVGSPQR